VASPRTGSTRLPLRAEPASTARQRLARVEVVANVAAGGVGPQAADELAAIFAEYGIAAHICTPQIAELSECLRAGIAADPDLLVVLAGDGTARSAAELAGADGPPIAPLPGGTMNMLSHAIYGVRPWQEALRLALDAGELRVIGGGSVEGKRFLCGAILGSPALWAPAREAVREGKGGLALRRARRALKRAFTGRLRYSLDGGGRAKTEALVLLCPVASKALGEADQVLEAAALNVRGAGEILRLGLNAVVRDWRFDPAVESEPCHVARVWSAHSIPAVLDGESVRLRGLIEVRYEPAVCRVLAPPRDAT
jgi:diacylglycerol kinase family enzyme